jgi:hypothetical protein
MSSVAQPMRFGQPTPTMPGLAPAQPQNNGTGYSIMNIFNGTPYPLMIVVAVVLIVTAIIFIMFRIRRGSTEATPLLKKSLINANSDGSQHYISPAGKLADATNGTEFSVSLWLYVENIENTGDKHKIIVYRGKSDTYSNGTFFVYMDAKTNKLYASVRTNAAVEDNQSYEPSLEDIRHNKYFLQSTVDYVPIQRWVNVIYTMKDATFSTFIDGDLYSVTSVYELPNNQFGSRPAPSKQLGDFLLAGRGDKPGFNGYIGNAIYYNFSVSIREARIIYNRGPYKSSWLRFFGMGNVGFRLPVYRINADDAK